MKQSLKNNLLLSHGLIAVFSIVLLVLSLIGVLFIKHDILKLTYEVVPTTQTAERLQTNVQASIAALRGWMSVPDTRFLEERDIAWRNGIYPNLNELTTLSEMSQDKAFTQKVSLLRSWLDNLLTYQTKIEDIAQTPGNYPAEHLMKTGVNEEASLIIHDITTLIEKEKIKEKQASSDIIFVLADFRGFFTKGHGLLSEYIFSDNMESLVEAKRAFGIAEKQLLQLESKKKNLTPDQQEIMKVLGMRFNIYLQFIPRLTELNANEGMDNKLLADKATPLTRRIINMLHGIVQVEKEKQMLANRNTEASIALFIYVLLGFIVFISILSFMLAYISSARLLLPIKNLLHATRKIEQGELDTRIPVERDDELGELAKSFNKMCLARRITEQKLNQIVQSAVDVIITIDAKSNVLSINQATTKLLGYTENELIGSNFETILPIAYRSKHRATIKKYLSTNNKTLIGKTREFKALTKAGECIPIMLSISDVLVDEEHLFVCMIHDISEEKIREAKINEINQQLTKENHQKSMSNLLSQLLRSAATPSAFARGILTFFAKHFKMKAGLFYVVSNPEQHVTVLSHYAVLRHYLSKGAVEAGFVNECIQQKEILSIDQPPKGYFKIKTGTGEHPPTHILLIPLIYNTAVIGAIEICLVHSPTKAEFELIDKLRQDIAIELNLSLSNEKLKKLLKKTELQREHLQIQEEELRASNEELESQAEVLKQSEEELSAANEALNKQISLIEKQKAKLKHQSDELKKTSQYKSTFLANMSHELRTPLNSLLILTQDLAKNKSKNLTDDQIESANVIYQSGKDLLSLINDILDISKVEAGKLHIDVQSMNIADVTKTLSRQFEPIAKEKGLTFKLICDKHLPASIETDPLRVMQILTNLLSNAFKFTEAGEVHIDLKQEGEQLAAIVSDTGIGIEKEKLESIFNAFEQADGSTSREYGGTGLGLSISKKLAELMNGTLRVKSEPGQGSTFTLKLPLRLDSNSTTTHEPPAALKPVPKSKIDHGTAQDDINNDRKESHHSQISKRPTVLVIDDDEAFAKSLGKIVQDNQFEALIAHTGKLGLSLATQHQPNGIILDLGLPDIDGELVLRDLKKNNKTKNIPVHIVSGHDRSHQMLNTGALSFLQKPVNRQDIEQILQKISDAQCKTILVVEDDLIAQKGLEDTIGRTHDIKLEFAETAKLAIKKINDKNYDCLIVDLGLPDVPGIAFIQSLVDEMNVLVPIIVYTARELTPEEYRTIKQYTNKIVIKGTEAVERLMDEVQLFLHHVENKTGIKPSPKPGSYTASQNTTASKRILLVDDDLRNTFALSKVLEERGYKVILADNGKVAIKKLETEEGFDLILMDMMMPVMDGYDAITKIKQMKNHQQIPIIALTAKATEQDREKCLKVGANDYMSKPIDVDVLLDLLTVWLPDVKEV